MIKKLICFIIGHNYKYNSKFIKLQDNGIALYGRVLVGCKRCNYEVKDDNH